MKQYEQIQIKKRFSRNISYSLQTFQSKFRLTPAFHVVLPHDLRQPSSDHTKTIRDTYSLCSHGRSKPASLPPNRSVATSSYRGYELPVSVSVKIKKPCTLPQYETSQIVLRLVARIHKKILLTPITSSTEHYQSTYAYYSQEINR